MVENTEALALTGNRPVGRSPLEERPVGRRLVGRRPVGRMLGSVNPVGRIIILGIITPVPVLRLEMLVLTLGSTAVVLMLRV